MKTFGMYIGSYKAIIQSVTFIDIQVSYIHSIRRFNRFEFYHSRKSAMLREARDSKWPPALT